MFSVLFFYFIKHKTKTCGESTIAFLTCYYGLREYFFFFGFSYNTFLFFLFVFFSQNYLCRFYFFNIELVKNYSYNMWRKHCSFPRKLLWIATMFFPTCFFLFFFIFFFSNCLCQFYYLNIELFKNYNYKKIQIRLNYVGKTL